MSAAKGTRRGPPREGADWVGRGPCGWSVGWRAGGERGQHGARAPRRGLRHGRPRRRRAGRGWGRRRGWQGRGAARLGPRASAGSPVGGPPGRRCDGARRCHRSTPRCARRTPPNRTPRPRRPRPRPRPRPPSGVSESAAATTSRTLHGARLAREHALPRHGVVVVAAPPQPPERLSYGSETSRCLPQLRVVRPLGLGLGRWAGAVVGAEPLARHGSSPSPHIRGTFLTRPVCRDRSMWLDLRVLPTPSDHEYSLLFGLVSRLEYRRLQNYIANCGVLGNKKKVKPRAPPPILFFLTSPPASLAPPSPPHPPHPAHALRPGTSGSRSRRLPMPTIAFPRHWASAAPGRRGRGCSAPLIRRRLPGPPAAAGDSHSEPEGPPPAGGSVRGLDSNSCRGSHGRPRAARASG